MEFQNRTSPAVQECRSRKNWVYTKKKVWFGIDIVAHLIWYLFRDCLSDDGNVDCWVVFEGMPNHHRLLLNRRLRKAPQKRLALTVAQLNLSGHRFGQKKTGFTYCLAKSLMIVLIFSTDPEAMGFSRWREKKRNLSTYTSGRKFPLRTIVLIKNL